MSPERSASAEVAPRPGGRAGRGGGRARAEHLARHAPKDSYGSSAGPTGLQVSIRRPLVARPERGNVRRRSVRRRCASGGPATSAVGVRERMAGQAGFAIGLRSLPAADWAVCPRHSPPRSADQGASGVGSGAGSMKAPPPHWFFTAWVRPADHEATPISSLRPRGSAPRGGRPRHDAHRHEPAPKMPASRKGAASSSWS